VVSIANRDHYQVPLASEADINVVVTHAFAMQSLPHTHCVQEVRGAPLEYTGANAIDDVVLITTFEDNRIDSLQVEQLSQ
jgi:hypothetical protein